MQSKYTKIFILFALLTAFLKDPTYAISKPNEIVILGQEISKTHGSSFLDVIELKDFAQFSSLEDLLNHQKGLSIMSQSGPGSLATLNVRGIGAGKAEQVLVLLDGVRLNTAQGNGVDFSQIPLAIIERVEIIKGGESALYGSDAIGGVINIKTKNTGPSIGYTFSKSSLFFNDDYKASLKIGPLVLHAQNNKNDYTYKNQNSGKPLRRLNNQLSSRGILLSHQGKLSSTTNYAVTEELNFSEKHIPGSTLFPTNDLQKDMRWLSSLRVTKKLSGDQKLSLSLPFRWTNQNFETPANNFNHKNIYVGTEALFQTPISFNHLTSVSLSFFTDSVQSDNLKTTHSKQTFALGLKDDYFLTSHLMLSPAIRFEMSPKNYKVVTPKLGLVHRFNQQVSLKSNISSSFRAPSFNELYWSSGWYVGNPILSPEQALDGDIGVVYKKEGLEFENSFFVSQIKNLISNKIDSQGVWKPQNLNKNIILGSELSFKSKLPFTKEIYVTANYTWLASHLAYRPRHKVQTSFEWQNASFKTSLDQEWVSRQKTGLAAPGKLSSIFLINIGGAVYISPKISLAAKIENLLNRQYERIAHYPMPSRSFNLSLSGTL